MRAATHYHTGAWQTLNTEKNVILSLLCTFLSGTPGLNGRVLMGMKPASSDWSMISGIRCDTLKLDEMYNCQRLKHFKFL